MALSKTIKAAIFLVFWWYVYLFWTPCSLVSMEMSRYFMVISSAPYRKLYYLKIIMITKRGKKKNTIKSDPTQEFILYCKNAIFPRKNSSTHHMKVIFIFWNKFSKGCSSCCGTYNFVIFEQNVRLVSPIS